MQLRNDVTVSAVLFRLIHQTQVQNIYVTHRGSETPYGDIELAQPWLR